MTPRPIIWNFKRNIVNYSLFITKLLIITVIITFEDERFVFILLDFPSFDEGVLFGFDLFQKLGCRFIGRILLNQFPPDGKVKDFLLCQRDGFIQCLRIAVNDIHILQQRFNLFYDSLLFCKWG